MLRKPPMMTSTKADLEPSRLDTFRCFLESIQRDQKQEFSKTINKFLSLITSSIGKYYKDPNISSYQKDIILEIAIDILKMAAKWSDAHTKNIKGKNLDNLLKSLNTRKIELKKKQKRFFRKDRLVVAVDELIKEFVEIKENLSSALSNESSSKLITTSMSIILQKKQTETIKPTLPSSDIIPDIGLSTNDNRNNNIIVTTLLDALNAFLNQILPSWKFTENSFIKNIDSLDSVHSTQKKLSDTNLTIENYRTACKELINEISHNLSSGQVKPVEYYLTKHQKLLDNLLNENQLAAITPKIQSLQDHINTALQQAQQIIIDLSNQEKSPVSLFKPI